MGRPKKHIKGINVEVSESKNFILKSEYVGMTFFDPVKKQPIIISGNMVIEFENKFGGTPGYEHFFREVKQ